MSAKIKNEALQAADHYCANNVSEIDHYGELIVRRAQQLLGVCIPRTLTAVEAISFANTIKSILQSSADINRLQLDFSGTKFIDSSGIGALTRIIQAAKTSGRLVSVSGARPTVESLLTMTNLDRLVQMKLK